MNTVRSPLSLELLRMSAPVPDIRAFREHVLSICQRWPDSQIYARLRELEAGGYLVAHGSPRTGWLTMKGRRALQQAS